MQNSTISTINSKQSLMVCGCLSFSVGQQKFTEATRTIQFYYNDHNLMFKDSFESSVSQATHDRQHDNLVKDMLVFLWYLFKSLNLFHGLMLFKYLIKYGKFLQIVLGDTKALFSFWSGCKSYSLFFPILLGWQFNLSVCVSVSALQLYVGNGWVYIRSSFSVL